MHTGQPISTVVWDSTSSGIWDMKSNKIDNVQFFCKKLAWHSSNLSIMSTTYDNAKAMGRNVLKSSGCLLSKTRKSRPPTIYALKTLHWDIMLTFCRCVDSMFLLIVQKKHRDCVESHCLCPLLAAFVVKNGHYCQHTNILFKSSNVETSKKSTPYML